MAERMPVTELDLGFSEKGARAIDWAEGRRQLEHAEVFWLSTVRPDGRPHVMPLLAVWFDGAMYFCTGPDERKARNLGQNPNCVLTTGQNALAGLYVVIEGNVSHLSDRSARMHVADTYESKYGRHLTAPEGTWFGLGDAIRGGDQLSIASHPRQLSDSRRVSSSARPAGAFSAGSYETSGAPARGSSASSIESTE